MIINDNVVNCKFIVTLENLQYFLMGLYNTTIFEWISDRFTTTPPEAVLNCTIYPLDLYKLFEIPDNWELQHLVVGGNNFNVPKLPTMEEPLPDDKLYGYDVGARACSKCLFTVGTIDFTSNNNMIGNIIDSFFMVEPYCDIQLYLPYIGFVSVLPSVVIGRKIIVKYAIDFNTRILTAFLYYVLPLNVDDNVIENEFLFMTIDGSIGYEVVLTKDGLSAVYTNLIQTAVKVGAAVYTSGASLAAEAANVEILEQSGAQYTVSAIQAKNNLNSSIAEKKASIIGNSINVFNASNATMKSGQYTGNFTPSTVKEANLLYALISIPTPNTPLAEYEKLYGRPLMKSRVLNNVHGFTTVANIHLENIGTASLGELSEIEQLLLSGVILP